MRIVYDNGHLAITHRNHNNTDERLAYIICAQPSRAQMTEFRRRLTEMGKANSRAERKFMAQGFIMSLRHVVQAQ